MSGQGQRGTWLGKLAHDDTIANTRQPCHESAFFISVIVYFPTATIRWWNDRSAADLQDVLTRTTGGSRMGERAQRLVEADRPDWGEVTT